MEIEIKKHDVLVQAVNGRELHARLEIKEQYSSWIKTQIERADLVQDVDFVTIKDKQYSPPRIEYFLTIDASKSIAMLSQTAKGKEVRAYFIECEKKLKEHPALNPANLSRLQLIQLALEAEQELQEAKQEIAVLEPKAQALDRIATESEGALNITNSAKTLQLQPKKLFSWLQANKWIYKRAGGKSWVAYQDKIHNL